MLKASCLFCKEATMDAKNLSQRLLTVAKYVPKGARLADIGSDHAYLPAYLALQEQISFGIAGEVVKGPYQNAVNEIQKEGLSGQITARLANGLAAIQADDQIDTITICGMGGPLICEILTAGKEKLAHHPLLILQPNVGEKNVRDWLSANNYRIEAEEIIAEDGHIYEIIVACYTRDTVVYTPKELLFGPCLLTKVGEVFQAKWHKELTKKKKVLAQLENAKGDLLAKKMQLQKEITLIEGVLNGES